MFDELKENTQEAQTTTTEVEVKQEVESPKVEANKEYNLRILRERAEKAEKRAAELERQKSYEPQRPQLDAPQQKVDSNDEDFNINDEDYVEGKDLKRYVKALKAEFRQTKQQLQEQAQHLQVQAAEQRLKEQFKDADQVLTVENIKNLETIYPEEFESIKNNPNPYSKMKTAYTLIKNLNLAEQYSQEDKKLAENKLKPRSAASVPSQGGETPLSKFADYGRRVLSDSQKDEIMRRVQLAKSMR